jgi:hypothetical protein
LVEIRMGAHREARSHNFLASSLDIGTSGAYRTGSAPFG